MIRAIIFDLDGTLVQSEKLKSLSYAIAVQRLRSLPEPDQRAVEAYREIVGAVRDVASKHIMDKLSLESELRPLMGQYQAQEPWQVLTALRKSIYNEMVEDPGVLQENQWPHNVGLLRIARETGCKIALATMSERKEVSRVLDILGLKDQLDLVLTKDDVKFPKPDPEIYLRAAQELAVDPKECLVLEDSPNGVKAGVPVGMNVIAVATPFTGSGLHTSEVLDHVWIVHASADLLEVVRNRIEEHNRVAH